MSHPPRPHAPELKALLEHLQGKTSPRKRLRIRAAVLTAHIIGQLQWQSRSKWQGRFKK